MILCMYLAALLTHCSILVSTCSTKSLTGCFSVFQIWMWHFQNGQVQWHWVHLWLHLPEYLNISLKKTCINPVPFVWGESFGEDMVLCKSFDLSEWSWVTSDYGTSQSEWFFVCLRDCVRPDLVLVIGICGYYSVQEMMRFYVKAIQGHIPLLLAWSLCEP